MCRCRGEEGSIGPYVGQTFWLHGIEVSTAKTHQGSSTRAVAKSVEWEYQYSKSTETIHRGKVCQEGPEAVQQTWRQNHIGDGCAIADRTLSAEPLPTSLRYQRYPIL